MVFASPSIVVELDPKVTIPTKVACPFASIVIPEPTLISLKVDIPTFVLTFNCPNSAGLPSGFLNSIVDPSAIS